MLGFSAMKQHGFEIWLRRLTVKPRRFGFWRWRRILRLVQRSPRNRQRRHWPRKIVPPVELNVDDVQTVKATRRIARPSKETVIIQRRNI